MKNNKANDFNGMFNCKKFMYVGGFENNMFNGDGEEIAEDYYFKGMYQNNLKVKGVLKWGVKNNSNIGNLFVNEYSNG